MNEDKCGTQHAISNCAISVADFIVLVPCTSVAWIKVVRTIYRIKCRNIKGRSSKLCKAKYIKFVSLVLFVTLCFIKFGALEGPG